MQSDHYATVRLSNSTVRRRCTFRLGDFARARCRGYTMRFDMTTSQENAYDFICRHAVSIADEMDADVLERCAAVMRAADLERTTHSTVAVGQRIMQSWQQSDALIDCFLLPGDDAFPDLNAIYNTFTGTHA